MKGETLALLLASIRYSLGTLEKEELVNKIHSHTIDWSLLLKLIQFHRLNSLLYNVFCEMGGTRQDFLECLKEKHYTNIVKNLLLSTKLSEIFKQFKSKKIPLLSVKGLSVAHWLYHKTGFRSAGDIDLLISKKDCDKALLCMKSMGYTLVYFPERLKPGSQFSKQFVRTQKDFVFIDEQSGVVIELHWRLSIIYQAFPLDFDKAWQNKVQWSMEGGAIQSLSATEHAVFICYHAARHQWCHMFWLYDIGLLIQNQETCWEKIFHQASLLNAQVSVMSSLLLAAEVFRIDISGIIQISEQNEQYNPILSEARKILYSENPEKLINKVEDFTSIRNELHWLQCLTHQTNIIQHWLRYILSPTASDWSSIKLPDRLTFLYIFWRPLRLIFKQLLYKSS